MKFTQSSNNFIIRLEKGESIINSLTKFCKNQKIQSGGFWAIGAVQSVELAFYHLDRNEYSLRKFDSPHEISSLIGNITLVEDKPFLHIHTVLSDENFNCIGGHLKDATVGATCEVYLTNLDTIIERKMDEDIGLKLLNCKAN